MTQTLFCHVISITFFQSLGLPCKDMRGRHKNQKHAFSVENIDMIVAAYQVISRTIFSLC